MGATQALLWRWESDKSTPSIAPFAALAKRYGVPMDALYYGPLPSLAQEAV